MINRETSRKVASKRCSSLSNRRVNSSRPVPLLVKRVKGAFAGRGGGRFSSAIAGTPEKVNDSSLRLRGRGGQLIRGEERATDTAGTN